MALTDADEDEKKMLLQKLLEFPFHKEFIKGKPKMPAITSTTTRSDLVGNQSWILFCLVQVTRAQVEAAAKGTFLFRNISIVCKKN